MITGQSILDALAPALNAGEATDTDLAWWSVAELLRYADQAAKRFGRTTGAFAARDDQAATAGTAAYPLPTGTVSVLRVSIDGRQLRAATADELAALDDDWLTTAGTTGKYTLDALGLGTLTLYPIPASGGDLVVVVHTAPRLASADATIAAPAIFADYLRYRAIGEARRKTGDAAAPEIAQHCDQRADLYERIFAGYYGGAQ